MKRVDLEWRGWGFRRYSPRGWWGIDTPIGSLTIDYHRSVTEQGLSRGRRQEYELRIPLTKNWQIHLSTNGKSYRELVGAPVELENLNWVLDEFDHNFNSLACASLRYHLDFSVCDNSDRRERYEDLIERLQERPPRVSDNDEERTLLRSRDWGDEASPEWRVLMDRFHEREATYDARINKGRHDFVDIIPELWS